MHGRLRHWWERVLYAVLAPAFEAHERRQAAAAHELSSSVNERMTDFAESARRFGSKPEAELRASGVDSEGGHPARPAAAIAEIGAGGFEAQMRDFGARSTAAFPVASGARPPAEPRSS